MSSAVDIANQALLMLGSLPIISFDDETVEASACKTLYPTAKKQILRSYPWRCATKYSRLAKLAEVPIDPNWKYAFAIPDDSLRILKITETGQYGTSDLKWTVEGKKVLTQVDNVAAQHIFEVSEPRMDVHVEMALVARMAVDLAYTLTASNSREAQMASLYEQKLNEARVTDRQEASHEKFKITTLDRVRR